MKPPRSKSICLNPLDTCSLSNTTSKLQTLEQQPQRQWQILRPNWVTVTVTLMLHIYTLLSTNLSANLSSLPGSVLAGPQKSEQSFPRREGYDPPSSMATPAFPGPRTLRPRLSAGCLGWGVALRSKSPAPRLDNRDFTWYVGSPFSTAPTRSGGFGPGVTLPTQPCSLFPRSAPAPGRPPPQHRPSARPPPRAPPPQPRQPPLPPPCLPPRPIRPRRLPRRH